MFIYFNPISASQPCPRRLSHSRSVSMQTCGMSLHHAYLITHLAPQRAFSCHLTPLLLQHFSKTTTVLIVYFKTDSLRQILFFLSIKLSDNELFFVRNALPAESALPYLRSSTCRSSRHCLRQIKHLRSRAPHQRRFESESRRQLMWIFLNPPCCDRCPPEGF